MKDADAVSDMIDVRRSNTERRGHSTDTLRMHTCHHRGPTSGEKGKADCMQGTLRCRAVTVPYREAYNTPPNASRGKAVDRSIAKVR